MAKRIAVSIASAAVILTVSLDAANAAAVSIPASVAPVPQTIVGATSGAYLVATFYFTPSASVALQYDTSQFGIGDGDTAVVTAANSLKGTRTYGGAVGNVSHAPGACQNTDLSAAAVTPSAPSLGYIASSCTN